MKYYYLKNDGQKCLFIIKFNIFYRMHCKFFIRIHYLLYQLIEGLTFLSNFLVFIICRNLTINQFMWQKFRLLERRTYRVIGNTSRIDILEKFAKFVHNRDEDTPTNLYCANRNRNTKDVRNWSWNWPKFDGFCIIIL